MVHHVRLTPTHVLTKALYTQMNNTPCIPFEVCALKQLPLILPLITLSAFQNVFPTRHVGHILRTHNLQQD